MVTRETPLKDMLALMRERGACESALAFGETYPPDGPTGIAAADAPDEAWALWVIQNLYGDLDEEMRSIFIGKVTGDNRYLLVKLDLVPGLTEADRAALLNR